MGQSPSMKDSWLLPDELATERLGQALARSCPWDEREPRVLYLSGELGAGKTTLAAALLRELGVTEAVRSPSYALIELYQLGQRCAVHVDLYRLQGRSELEQLGLRDYLNGQTLLLIEWPERGAGALPGRDLALRLDTQPMRRATVSAGTEAGDTWLKLLRSATETEGES
jgi:tRNA threonylcarbamoyladenosine biosynthesis protein TsaE